MAHPEGLLGDGVLGQDTGSSVAVVRSNVGKGHAPPKRFLLSQQL